MKDKAQNSGHKVSRKPMKEHQRCNKRRNLIVVTFARVKDWRRILKRYEKRPKAFLSAVAFAATAMSWPDVSEDVGGPRLRPYWGG